MLRSILSGLFIMMEQFVASAVGKLVLFSVFSRIFFFSVILPGIYVCAVAVVMCCCQYETQNSRSNASTAVFGIAFLLI